MLQTHILTNVYKTACTTRTTHRSLLGDGRVIRTPGTNAINRIALTISFTHIYTYPRVYHLRCFFDCFRVGTRIFIPRIYLYFRRRVFLRPPKTGLSDSATNNGIRSLYPAVLSGDRCFFPPYISADPPIAGGP